jgi:hypothetical protein
MKENGDWKQRRLDTGSAYSKSHHSRDKAIFNGTDEDELQQGDAIHRSPLNWMENIAKRLSLKR